MNRSPTITGLEQVQGQDQHGYPVERVDDSHALEMAHEPLLSPESPSVDDLAAPDGHLFDDEPLDHFVPDGHTLPPIRAARDARGKLIWSPGANRLPLFDLGSDPDEWTDLAGDPARERDVARLSSPLRGWQRDVADGAPPPPGEIPRGRDDAGLDGAA